MSASKAIKVLFDETDIPLLGSMVFDANGGAIGKIIKRRLYELETMKHERETIKLVLAQIGPRSDPDRTQIGPRSVASADINETSWADVEELS